MVTLDRLVNVLGGYGVRPAGSPVSRATGLRGVVIPEGPGARAAVGDVLLAVGAESVDEAVRWALEAQAVVVLARAGDDRDPATEPSGGLGASGSAGADPATGAARAGLAVLLVESAVSWSELAAVVYGLVLEGRETESGRGPTDLFALADSLADAIGAPVTIEDRLSRVLAYSGSQQPADPARVETILERRVPERLRTVFERRGVFAHLEDSDEPLFVPAAEEHGLIGRTVVAVRVGRELLGFVWVSRAEPLDGPRRQALVDGARTVALHVLRSRASADLERQVESELVIRLLEGTADAATVVSRLGLPPGPARVIAVRAHRPGDRHAALLVAFEHATTGFGWSRPGRSTLGGNALYTILPGESAAAARRWVSALRDALPAEVQVAAGISATAATPDLPAAWREADECLALHERRTPDTEPPAYDESWNDILLQRLHSAARAGRVPARGPVAELRRHDREHGTRYVETLRAWLEAQGDHVRAAEGLAVHENTVRNRLRKMERVTSLDLRDPRKRLAMMIELAVEDNPATK